MKIEHLQKILNQFKDGKINLSKTTELLTKLPFESLNFAHLDNHRELRTGFPEVIYCEGKTPTQTAQIAKKIFTNNKLVFATHASKQHFAAVKKIIPKAKYYNSSKVITVNEPTIKKSKKFILIISAGTADIPIAEEAFITTKMMGQNVKSLFDVGVAGIHRLLSHFDEIQKASVIIVLAGMDGALPSVVGGLVKVPIIAVPTSTGYGANFSGLAPLLTMLNSCAAGVTVVNINNGFGAGYAASIILKNMENK